MLTIKEELEIQKQICCDMLGGKCWVCGCIHAKRGMTIHHLWYIKNDIVYKNYPQNDSGRLQYYKDLEEMIKRNPKRFLCLCNNHHFVLEKLCRFGDPIFKKLCIARNMTKT